MYSPALQPHTARHYNPIQPHAAQQRSPAQAAQQRLMADQTPLLTDDTAPQENTGFAFPTNTFNVYVI